jgi:hypothetical protein
MFKLLTLMTITALVIACTGHLMAAKPTLTPTATIAIINGISIKPMTVQVREEKRLPIGQPPTANRDIGFAAVFLQVENQQQTDATIVIEQIQIVDAVNGQIYMTTHQPKTIPLKPLEYAASDFHLTNKTGLGAPQGVQAIVTYHIAGQRHTIVSPVVAIERF